jgi:hypothetical protein
MGMRAKSLSGGALDVLEAMLTPASAVRCPDLELEKQIVCFVRIQSTSRIPYIPFYRNEDLR